MYNSLLDVFIVVVESGSFTKASNSLFLSPTAVMKKINNLEKHFNLKLIDRTPSGIKLTSPGKIIYREAKRFKEESDKVIKEAIQASTFYDTTFCVGTSMLNPAKVFMDLWYKVNDKFPDYKLHLVPFEDDHNGIVSEIKKLGEKFDFLVGVCDSKTWLSLCNFFPLGRYKKMIAVSRNHHLANKKIIEISDLYGETLMMVQEGDSGINDLIRHDLKVNHPLIKIEDTPKFYDLSVFNRCAETNNVLLTIECWKDIRPDLLTIPVNWDYDIPYGLLYSLNAPKDVLRFIEELKSLNK